jgi:transcriptional regulator with XRE-family HTH domain
MPAKILRFVRHRTSVRQGRKKVICGDCAPGHLLDLRGGLPRRKRVPSAQTVDGGAVDADKGRDLFLGETFLGDPFVQRHAQEYARHANARQARFAPGDMDAVPADRQNVGMPAKRATKLKPLPATKPAKRPLGATKLKEWREFAHLKQPQLGEKIGKDSSVISRIENQHVPYDQYHLEAVATAVGCEPWQLLLQDPRDPAWIYKFIMKLPQATRAELLDIAKTWKA